MTLPTNASSPKSESKSNKYFKDMRSLQRLISAIHRKGLIPALKAGFNHLQSNHREFEIQRWYREANASNKRFDLQHGVETSAAVEVADLDVDASESSESNRFQSIYEDLFEEAFHYVRIDHSNFSFIDFGSGKGKALLLASRYPFKRIIGVEFSASLCETCKRNLDLFTSPDQKTKAFEIVCVDARHYEFPLDSSVFFFFNPFHGALMQDVVENIASSLRVHPRPAWIVYCNPDCASLIDAEEQFEPVAAGKRFGIWRARTSASLAMTPI